MKIYTLFLAVTLPALSGCDDSELTYMVGTLERDRVEVSVESNEPIVSIEVQDGQKMSIGSIKAILPETRMY